MKQRTNKRIRNVHLLPNADENEVRSRSKRGGRRGGRLLLIRLGIVAAVLCVLFLLWKNWDKIAPETVLDWAYTQFGEGETGDGYPYTITGNDVIGMGQASNYLAVLTDTSLKFLDKTAACVEERPNTLNDPLLKTAGRYALVTEVGGSRFKLETRRQTVLEMELQNRCIYAADVLSSGRVAVITDAATQSHVCAIQVYSSGGDLLYEYKSGKYLITNVSLMPNGRGMAAVGTTAEGGALKSVLLLFTFSSETPTEYTGNDQLLYDVVHFGNTVLAVGDSGYWIVSVKNQTVEKTDYDGMELIGYAASHSVAGMVMKQSGSTGTGEVWLFGKDGALLRKHPFAGTYRYAACDGTEFAVLTDTVAFTLNDKEIHTQVSTPSDALMIGQYNDALMVLTLTELRSAEQ